MLDLAIHRAARCVLVQPHYPENVGACARALKTMGFYQLALVKPGRLADPSHEMARKMAVKSRDVLDSASCFPTLAEALAGSQLVFGLSSRRGLSGVLLPRQAAEMAERHALRGGRLALVLGNEKTGLSEGDLALCHERVRIPMAADQPSINLAQAVQLLAYELFLAALATRNAQTQA